MFIEAYHDYFMKILLHLLTIGVFLMIYPSTIFAQRIKIDEAYADRENKKIYIPYEIKESSKYHNLFNISISYTQGKDKDYGDTLTQVSGDVGKDITPGKKMIVWDYAKEDSTFNGQNVVFKLTVISRLDPRYLGGPEKALYSLLLPGLGNTKVRPPAKFWYLPTVGVAALVGGGIYMRRKSNQTLEEYRQSSTIEEAQDLFNKSNNQKVISGSLFVAAGALWLGDIIQVAIKGFKNRKEAKTMEPLPESPKKNKPEIGLHIEQFQNTPLWGLSLKF